jgi:predicted RNA-binding protein with PUA-like domain
MEQGATETWLVTRFIDEIKKGDTVFFWMAGPPDVRGLYGWGKVIGEKPEYESGWGYGIDVKYVRKFPRHIPFIDVKSISSFSDFVLFKTAIGTNFRLSDSQTRDLIDLISQRFGKDAAP